MEEWWWESFELLVLLSLWSQKLNIFLYDLELRLICMLDIYWYPMSAHKYDSGDQDLLDQWVKLTLSEVRQKLSMYSGIFGIWNSWRCSSFYIEHCVLFHSKSLAGPYGGLLRQESMYVLCSVAPTTLYLGNGIHPANWWVGKLIRKCWARRSSWNASSSCGVVTIPYHVPG
jgi:hypothetical protein